MMEKRGLAAALSLGILTALFLAGASPAFALPTADNFGVEDTSAQMETNAVVPVNITNVQTGPVVSIIFDLTYGTRVINATDVQKGTLTSFWDSPAMNNFAWGTRVSIVYKGEIEHGIQDGKTGSVAILTFSVVGTPGSTSNMNLSNIQLADTGYTVGTAPAKNGTFSILTEPTPSPAPTQPSAGEGGGRGGGSSGTRAPPSAVAATPTPSPSLAPSVIIPPASTPAPSVAPTPLPTLPPFPMIRLSLVIPIVVAVLLLAVTYRVLRR